MDRDKTVVARWSEELAELPVWHLVTLHNAVDLLPGKVRCDSIVTACGVDLGDEVKLTMVGAPSEPTCAGCLCGSDDPLAGLWADIHRHVNREVLAAA